MSAHVSIPEELARNNIGLYGAEGEAWLRNMPKLLAEFEQRWSIEVGPPFANLSFNYAAPGVRSDGTPVVVKACYPGSNFSGEAEALRLYAGRGAVQLLDADIERGVVLLEHIAPGTLLSTVEDDDAATSIAATVMRQLWTPPPENHSFPTVADWGKGFARMRSRFNGGSGPLTAKLADEAEQLFKEMLGSMSAPVVLHGDLHHFNILAATREPWLAIDPQGVIGEPEYEVGALLRNPMPEIASRPGLSNILFRRIDILADELGFDQVRLRAWGMSQAVLSAWWSIEDNSDGWDVSMAIAKALSKQ